MSYTPDTLREGADPQAYFIDEADKNKYIRAHADAWEAQNIEHAQRVHGLDLAIDALRQRLEAARIPALRLQAVAAGKGPEPPFEDWIHRAWVYERAQNILDALATGEE